jgi:hypothetical protein
MWNSRLFLLCDRNSSYVFIEHNSHFLHNIAYTYMTIQPTVEALHHENTYWQIWKFVFKIFVFPAFSVPPITDSEPLALTDSGDYRFDLY